MILVLVNKKVFLGLYKLEDSIWKLIKVFICEPKEFIEVNRRDLFVDNEQILILIPKKVNDFPTKANELPTPDSLRIDRSLVAERCSINFSLKKSYSSYQGEYPLEMTLMSKGSFLSFDTLKEFKNKDVLNFIIFMNISKDAFMQDEIEIDIVNPNNKKIINKLIAKRNSFSVYRIPNEKDQFNKNQTKFYRSSECSFLPIFLSVDLKTFQLSVEHTHPPTEMIHGVKKFEVIKHLKNRWL